VWQHLKRIALLCLITPPWIYKRYVSPLLPPMCRHEPTCSVFMIQAIQQKGIIFGPLLGAWRILRCQPFGTYGWDPVEAWPPWFIAGRIYFSRDKACAAAEAANLPLPPDRATNEPPRVLTTGPDTAAPPQPPAARSAAEPVDLP
jgi:putative membrane protein insertion efficiency factor